LTTLLYTIIKMYQELQYQKNKLRTNLELLRHRKNENALLETVVEDYQRYDNHLKEQDKSHALQMDFIAKYIQDIIQTNNLTENGLANLKKDHDSILTIIKNIKNKLV
jgi:hypothetical protein